MISKRTTQRSSMINLTDARDIVDELKAERSVATKALSTLEEGKVSLENHIKEIVVVQEVFQSAIKLLYDNLSMHLGGIITEGLSMVFPDSNYQFVIDFVERRGTVEADLWLEDDEGERYHPLDAVGGGISDFVSLLLRITYLILSDYENTLICDEPGKFISSDKREEAANFLKKICEDFDFQVLMVSHIPEMIQCANVVYTLKKQRGVSYATKIKG